MSGLSPIIEELTSTLKKRRVSASEQALRVTHIGSSVGGFYEKLRNVIDYKDEHLLRRNAIERILKRRLLFKNGEPNGEGLVKELTWAGYLKNETVGHSIVEKIDRAVEKHGKLLGLSISGVNGNSLRGWLLGVLSAEVDEILVPQVIEEALNRAMFRLMAEKLKLRDTVNNEDRDVQIFLGVRKALFREDLATVRYHLLLTYVPEWGEAYGETQEKLIQSFPTLYPKLEGQIKNPLNSRLAKFFQPLTPPFLIIKDVIERSENFETLISDHDEFSYQIEKACERRYHFARVKLSRSILRSTIYIFLTKMTLAYLLEMPADLYLYGKIKLLPLGINIAFPPILMFMVGSSIKIPGRENTERIRKMVSDIVYQAETPALFPEKFEVPNFAFGRIFGGLYFVGFIVSFGLIIYLLQLLRFGFPSIVLFLFFLSVVSFFAYRIRLTAREYMVLGQKEGIISSLIDFFTLPFLQMGHWLSSEFSKINIFMFVLDFIIEAPFKAFIEVAEDWIRFLKQKKEEII